MHVTKLRVKNLRSIRDASLDLGAVTPLLGPNGSGKSTWLLALRWFYEGAPPNLAAPDFFGGDWYGREIEVSVTFVDLPNDLGETDPRLMPYIRGDSLTIVMRIPGLASDEEVRPGRAQYFGTLLQHKPFADIRRSPEGSDGKTKAALSLKNEDLEHYGSIPLTARGWPANNRALLAWEADHQELCELMDDDGQLFGPISQSGSPLNSLTELITVPAVHDPAAEVEATGSNLLNQLVHLSVLNPADSEEAAAIRQDAEARFQGLIRTHESTDLRTLGGVVSSVLERYAPGTAARFGYRGGDTTVRPPVAYVSLNERGFEGPPDRKGSGLQRLFIVSLIEAVASAGPVPGSAAVPAERHRILCVEEPELYQHPLQARRFAQVLWDLAGARSRHQVLYSTHSPEFLPAGRLDAYRLCIAEPNSAQGEPVASNVRSTNMDAVIGLLQAADTPETWLQPGRLDNFFEIQMDATIREGFFAQGVVLVEGPEDVAVIDAHSCAIGDPLESRGIAVLPVGGKANITRMAAAFAAFRLPTYLVFDNDSNQRDNKHENHADRNRSIQKFAGHDKPEDFPQTAIFQRFAVFDPDLTRSIPTQFPDGLFEHHQNEIAEELGWPRPSDTSKNPNALRAIIVRLYAESGPARLLSELHEAIVARMSPEPASDPQDEQ